MENQNHSKSDHYCSESCCVPPKKISTWKKWISIAVILAAAAIITVKLMCKEDATQVKCCDNHEDAICCPHAKLDTNE